MTEKGLPNILCLNYFREDKEFLDEEGNVIEEFNENNSENLEKEIIVSDISDNDNEEISKTLRYLFP